jgi:hypothetical protein
MRELGELDAKGLPCPIPASELQEMLGPSQAFYSWDASISKVSEEMARWPFLFSGCQEPAATQKRSTHPLIGLAQTAAQPRYSITISAANATAGTGSEIRVQIVQKNTTDRDQPFWIVSVETTWRIRVLD